ncbi:hypothetical protein COT76_00955 [Candidatus Berkelbacteria bacterium CG10_big_fil_rev_8_21_14_0_10_33_10]|nr:MAG: hypothetical protein COT76_00955 [Candidatus Berkelbacteria bacterium CG10_big_fil_rev_8_21_14_0_10_33_10]
MSNENMSKTICTLISQKTNFWLDHQPVRYVNKETKFDPNNFVRFDLGEWISSCSPKTKEVFQNLKAADLQEYPDPNATELKNAIANRFGISPEMITPSSGTDELIDTLPRLLLSKGDRAVIIRPTFFRFDEATSREGGEIIKVDTNLENHFRFDESTARQVIEQSRQPKTDIVWLCNPNNPTGQIIAPELLEWIITETKSFVIVDEVFSGLLDPTTTNKTLLLTKTHQNVLFLRSLSKVDGLSAIRIGWGIGHPKTIELIEKWRLPFNTSTLAQKIAIAALEDTQHTADVRNLIINERQFLEQQISLIPGLELISGSQANIFLLRHKQKDLFQQLFQRGILVADFRQADGLEDMGFVRITVQDNNKNLKLLKALQRI